MNTSLTPAEIAAIKEKLNLITPESPHDYIAAALELTLEYAAEIKRLKLGMAKMLEDYSLPVLIQLELQQLLNSQP